MDQMIAAIDLGTSKSIALVAKKDFTGKLSVVRTETLLSKNAIRRGRVYNSDETSDIISKLIRKLNSDPALQIEKIYVGIGGQSLRTQLLSVKREIEGGTINQQLLDSIKEEASRYKPEFEENFGVVSREYHVDGQPVSNPKGIMASVIEAQFQIIVGNPCLKLNMEKVFKEKGISVAGYFVSPVATAAAVLTPEEKEAGCALIEWGEGITYISIYKNKALKYLATLPLGGLTITKDIRSLNVSEEEAEVLKIKYGKAGLDPNDTGDVSVNEEEDSSRKIELRNLNWIIEARVDEIVKNIWTQIQVSGYSQALGAGIAITGGGALLRDLPQYIQNQTGKEVRLVNAKVWVNQIETQLSPANSCIVGLAILGDGNCLKVQAPKEIPQPVPLFTDEKMNEREKARKKNSGTSSKSSEESTLKKKLRVIFDKGVKKVDKGVATLFADEEFDNAATKTVNDDTPVTR